MTGVTAYLAQMLSESAPHRFRVHHDGWDIAIAGDAESCGFVRAFHDPYIRFVDGHGPADALVLAVRLPGVEELDDQVDDQRRFLRRSTSREVLGLEYHHRPLAQSHVLFDRRAHRVVVASTSSFALRRQLSALLRDQVLGSLDSTNGFEVLHAAGAVRDGIGIAVTGPPGAGKTSTLLALLSTGEWDFVSNDRLKLRQIAGRVEMRGVAARCNLDPRVLQMPKLFGAPIPAAVEGRQAADARKVPVDPRQILALVGRDIVPSCELRVIVVPEVDDDFDDLQVEVATDASAIASVLDSNRLDHTESNTNPDWLGWRWPENLAAAASVAALSSADPRLCMVRIRCSFDVLFTSIRSGRLRLEQYAVDRNPEQRLGDLA